RDTTVLRRIALTGVSHDPVVRRIEPPAELASAVLVDEEEIGGTSHDGLLSVVVDRACDSRHDVHVTRTSGRPSRMGLRSADAVAVVDLDGPGDSLGRPFSAGLSLDGIVPARARHVPGTGTVRRGRRMASLHWLPPCAGSADCSRRAAECRTA